MEDNIKKTNRRPIIYIAIAAIIVAVLAVCIILFMNRSTRLIKVIESNGDVTVERNADIIQAYVDMILKNKDTVTTGEDSNLYLQLDSDKYVEVAANSKLYIIATGKEEKNNTRTKIVLEDGSVMNEITKKLGEEETFDIETPSVSMCVRGTKFTVDSKVNDSGTKETYIEVTEGTVEAYREDESDTVKIEAGYNATINETDKLSDIELEENLPYFDFGFNLYDIRLFGKTIEELDIEEIREEYDINYKDEEKAKLAGITIEETYFSPDRELAYVVWENGTKAICIHTVIREDERYTWVYSESEDKKTIHETSNSKRKDNLIDKYLTRILSDDMNEAKAREFISADILDSLMDEDKRFIKCNWSDDVYAISITDSAESYNAYFVQNTITNKRFGIKIEVDDEYMDEKCSYQIQLNK